MTEPKDRDSAARFYYTVADMPLSVVDWIETGSDPDCAVDPDVIALSELLARTRMDGCEAALAMIRVWSADAAAEICATLTGGKK